MRNAANIVRTVFFAACLTASSVLAQDIGVVQNDVLILNSDKLFSETLLGQNMLASLQTERDEIIEQNRKIETDLVAEEKALTKLRAEKTPQEFRELADQFDKKVQGIRRESERRVRDLERNHEQAPIVFMRIVEPVLIDLMKDAKASVILEQRSVLMNSEAINVTDLAISLIDQKIGRGETLSGANDSNPDDQPEASSSDE